MPIKVPIKVIIVANSQIKSKVNKGKAVIPSLLTSLPFTMANIKKEPMLNAI